MASRFNTLYLGTAEETYNELENGATPDEMRVALCNALRHITALEKRLAALETANRLRLEREHPSVDFSKPPESCA